MTIKTMQQTAIAHLGFSTIKRYPPGIATNPKIKYQNKNKGDLRNEI